MCFSELQILQNSSPICPWQNKCENLSSILFIGVDNSTYFSYFYVRGIRVQHKECIQLLLSLRNFQKTHDSCEFIAENLA